MLVLLVFARTSSSGAVGCVQDVWSRGARQSRRLRNFFLAGDCKEAVLQDSVDSCGSSSSQCSVGLRGFAHGVWSANVMEESVLLGA
jgi:hypothetical protein